jgi:uncharacterized membrane-anchored protein YhcB (DUF1043 family)
MIDWIKNPVLVDFIILLIGIIIGYLLGKLKTGGNDDGK